MSDHSNPRRWTLTGLRIVGKGRDYAGVLPSIEPSLAQDEVVPVREDCITEADVEAVAKLLDHLLLMPRSASTPDVRITECRRYARTLLSVVFEGGER